MLSPAPAGLSLHHYRFIAIGLQGVACLRRLRRAQALHVRHAPRVTAQPPPQPEHVEHIGVASSPNDGEVKLLPFGGLPNGMPLGTLSLSLNLKLRRRG